MSHASKHSDWDWDYNGAISEYTQSTYGEYVIDIISDMRNAQSTYALSYTHICTREIDRDRERERKSKRILIKNDVNFFFLFLWNIRMVCNSALQCAKCCFLLITFGVSHIDKSLSSSYITFVLWYLSDLTRWKLDWFVGKKYFFLSCLTAAWKVLFSSRCTFFLIFINVLWNCQQQLSAIMSCPYWWIQSV